MALIPIIGDALDVSRVSTLCTTCASKPQAQKLFDGLMQCHKCRFRNNRLQFGKAHWTRLPSKECVIVVHTIKKKSHRFNNG